MRRTLLAALVLASMLTAGLGAQTLSDQVLRLLTRANYWTGVQTIANTVGLTLESGSGLSGCTNVIENRGGNLYFNCTLVATSAGAGTVTAVALTMPTGFSVSGSPITSSGTLAVTLANETANYVLAGPTSGGATTPAFRALVDADIPDTITINGTNNVTWASVSKSGSSLADLATVSAAALSSGTLPNAVFPATLPAVSGVNLTNLNASQLASGTIPNAQFPATLPATSGVNLTALNASNLGSGSVPCARTTALTGDVTTSGCAATLAATAVSAGSYGDASHTLSLTVDAKGRLTAVSTNSVTPGAVDLTSGVTGILPVANGGSGLSSTPSNGQLLIGNATNYSLATLTGTASQITVTNGSGTITLALPQSIATTSTPQFARLGLGTGAGSTAVLTTTGTFNIGYYSIGNCAAAATANWALGMAQTVTLTGSPCVLTFTGALTGSQIYELSVVQDGTGSRTVTWPTIRWAGGSAPTLTTTANAIDDCFFRWTGTSYLGWCQLNF